MKLHRRLLILLALFWLPPLRSNAEPELAIALKGGPNAATLDHDFRVNKYGFSGGLSGQIQWWLSDRFSLAGQIDLLYTPRGAEAVFEGVSQGSLRQHYFDVMVSARPEVWLGRASVYLLLGGGLNFLVRASDESAAGMSQNVTDNLRRIDVALLAGVGVALHLARGGLGPFRAGAIFLEARHDHGLIDIDIMNGGFKNRTSAIMLGLSFTMGSPTPPATPATTAGPSK